MEAPVQALQPSPVQDLPLVNGDAPARSDSLARRMGLSPRGVAGDIMNSVNYYCAQGLGAFEETISDAAGLSEEQRLAFVKGSTEVFERTINRLQRSLEDFEKQTLAGCLSVPPDLSLQQAEPASLAIVVSEGEEAMLDKQLEELREQIKQARLGKQQLEKETASLSRELAGFGNAAPLAAVANVASSGKENLVEDSASIAKKALQLCPLLDKAEQILQQCQEASAARLNLQDAAIIVEKDIVQRKAAANGAHAQDLRLAQSCILAD